MSLLMERGPHSRNIRFGLIMIIDMIIQGMIDTNLQGVGYGGGGGGVSGEGLPGVVLIEL